MYEFGDLLSIIPLDQEKACLSYPIFYWGYFYRPWSLQADFITLLDRFYYIINVSLRKSKTNFKFFHQIQINERHIVFCSITSKLFLFCTAGRPHAAHHFIRIICSANKREELIAFCFSCLFLPQRHC